MMASVFVLSLSVLASFLIILQPSAANPVCKESYGVGIDSDHCIEALGTLQAQLLSPHGGSSVQTFSRHSTLTRKLQHMPQGFAWKTCSIGIDLADPVPPDFTVSSNWENLSKHLLQLLQTCAQRRGTGGRLIVDGFDFIIISPTAGIGRDTCLAPPRYHSMSLGRCIDGRVQIKEQRALAGMQRLAAPPYLGRNAPSSLQPETRYPSMGRNIPPLPLVAQHGFPPGPPAAPPPRSQTYLPFLATLDQLHQGMALSPQHPPLAPPRSAPIMIRPAVARPHMNQALQPRPDGQHGNPQPPERRWQRLLPPVNSPPARPPLARPRPPLPRVIRHQYLLQDQPTPPQAIGLAQAPPSDFSSS